MPKQDINYGSSANDTNADSIRTAFQKSKENFDELYANKADTSALTAGLATKADASALAAKADASSVTTALATKADATATTQALAGKADLVSGKVPSSQLPAYVDDVLEFANQAAFPVTGTSGIIYVTQDTNKEYRWSGSTYIELVSSPGSTDAVPEGTVNRYFTPERAVSALQNDLGLIDIELDAKANTADVNTALATKANNSDLLNKASVGTLAHLIPNVFGATDSNMKWIKRAFARLRAGTGRIRFGIIGDSTSAISSGSDFSKSWPVQFLTELLVHGFGPINREAINLGYSDTRVSGGTGWGRSYNQSIGNSTTTNPLVVTPNGTGDTIDFWYIPDSAASFTYSLNGGAAVTVPVNAATDGAAVKISVPCGSVGAHSISFSRVSGYVVLSSLEFYTAGVPDISAHIRGFAGSKIADWCKSTVAGYGSYGIPSRAIRGLNCDLNIVMLGINDVDQAVPLATSQTQLSAIIDDLKAMNSDVILMTFHPCNSANTIANQVAFNDMVRALAATKGIPLIDLFAHHVSYAQAQAMSYTSDNLHYNDNGKAEEAAFIATSVLKAAGRL